ncbi:hypothetical protein MSBR3_0720 [Methanosarcina barkeri 3]|uniref:Uncharacterized protein n=1 Tax=Methanosarcina barkeri 3 TaxID=1434107 RepID=A0A0E3SKX3_METBA|nr:hypothetical protein MSBR3_0720 [Methanosarcina barkeri 3]
MVFEPLLGINLILEPLLGINLILEPLLGINLILEPQALTGRAATTGFSQIKLKNLKICSFKFYISDITDSDV